MSVRCDCGGDHEPWQHPSSNEAREIAEEFLAAHPHSEPGEDCGIMACTLARAYLGLVEKVPERVDVWAFEEVKALRSRIKELEAERDAECRYEIDPGHFVLCPDHNNAAFDRWEALSSRLSLAEGVVEAARELELRARSNRDNATMNGLRKALAAYDEGRAG